MKKENAFLRAILPARCVFCGRVTALENGVCSDCFAALPVVGDKVCTHCGRDKKRCSCRKGLTFYDGVTAPFYYEGVVRRGVHSYKFRFKKPCAAYYGQFIAEKLVSQLPGQKFDYAVSVPVSKKKQRGRAFDHGELIARAAADELGIDYRGDILKKIYETDCQHDLGLLLRRGNLAGAFDVALPESVKGRRILLIDDIMTSGETLNECAKMLCLAGAESVHCAVLAVTELKKKEQK